MVDELDAFALILEGWVGESPPATVLALLFIGWPRVLTGKALEGPTPTPIVAPTVFVAVLMIETLLLSRFGTSRRKSRRVDSQALGTLSNGHGGEYRVSCRVYHGDRVAKIRHIGKSPIGSESYSNWSVSNGYGRDYRVARGAYDRDIGRYLAT